MVIVKYNSVVCEIYLNNKLGGNRGERITFLEFFEGTDEAFIAKWKPKYPNHRFQIFRHPRKPLLFDLRVKIENSPEIKSKLRDYNLSKLLD